MFHHGLPPQLSRVTYPAFAALGKKLSCVYLNPTCLCTTSSPEWVTAPIRLHRYTGRLVYWSCCQSGRDDLGEAIVTTGVLGDCGQQKKVYWPSGLVLLFLFLRSTV